MRKPVKLDDHTVPGSRFDGPHHMNEPVRMGSRATVTAYSPKSSMWPEHGKEETPVEPLMYRPTEAAHMLGIGRTRVFALIKSGQLRSVKLGGGRFITADALRAFVRELEQESADQAEAV